MRIHIVVRALSLVATLVWSGAVGASSIGVFTRPDGSDCDTDQPVGSTGTLYVLAILGGDSAAQGITGAEYRLWGFPAEWEVLESTPNPVANVVLGNPLGAGVNIAFPSCQPANTLLLHTIRYRATTFVDNWCIGVDQHTTPSSPHFECVRAVLCNAPDFSSLCVPGGTATVNGSCVDKAPCNTVGVVSRPWSKVKSLYQE